MKQKSCKWALNSEKEKLYHDTEWGKPKHDDKIIFEFLILEIMQAGLSWATILNKRENFKKAFDDFDVLKIAKYDQKKVELLLKDEGIIRNKLKINATINNANKFIDVQKKYGSFSNYIWSFVENKPIINNFKADSDIPANTKLSDKITKDLKNKGFKFVGSTIVYSFMQAIGIVNDHIEICEFKN